MMLPNGNVHRKNMALGHHFHSFTATLLVLLPGTPKCHSRRPTHIISFPWNCAGSFGFDMTNVFRKPRVFRSGVTGCEHELAPSKTSSCYHHIDETILMKYMKLTVRSFSWLNTFFHHGFCNWNMADYCSAGGRLGNYANWWDYSAKTLGISWKWWEYDGICWWDEIFLVGCFFQIPMWFLSRSVYFTGWWWGRLVMWGRYRSTNATCGSLLRPPWPLPWYLNFAIDALYLDISEDTWKTPESDAEKLGGLKIQWSIMVIYIYIYKYLSDG